jgi:hypothetical protein
MRGLLAWFVHRTYHLMMVPTVNRKARVAADWALALLFRREVGGFGSFLRTPSGSVARPGPRVGPRGARPAVPASRSAMVPGPSTMATRNGPDDSALGRCQASLKTGLSVLATLVPELHRPVDMQA